jgi:regulatory protein
MDASVDTKPSLQDLISATEAVPLAHESGAQDAHSEARNIVLNQLNFMPRSRKELETTLAKRHVEPDVAKSVLDRFEEIGMVDDAAFAELLIRSRCNTKRVSRSVLRQQLRQKGVNQEIIEEALLVVSDADELRMATELVERKARAMSRLEPEVRKRRLFGLLARKGYNTSIALRVIQDLEAADFNGAEVMSDLSL